jgi:hypothetical protein
MIIGLTCVLTVGWAAVYAMLQCMGDCVLWDSRCKDETRSNAQWDAHSAENGTTETIRTLSERDKVRAKCSVWAIVSHCVLWMHAVWVIGSLGAQHLRSAGSLGLDVFDFRPVYAHRVDIVESYALQLAFYAVDVLIMWRRQVLQDVRRKDDVLMWIHHAVSVFLLVLSFATKYTVTGLIVVLIHDCSDPFLHAAKVCRVLQWRRMETPLFALFTVFFCIPRLVGLPLFLTFLWRGIPTWTLSVCAMFGMLCALLCINMLWAGTVLRVCIRAVRGEELRDPREEQDLHDIQKTHAMRVFPAYSTRTAHGGAF